MRPGLYFGNVILFNINSLGLLLLPYQAEEYNWTGLMFVLSRLFCAEICCVSCCYGGGKGRLTENNMRCCLMGHRSLHIPLHHCHSSFSQTHLAPVCKDCDFCDMESRVHSYARQSENQDEVREAISPPQLLKVTGATAERYFFSAVGRGHQQEEHLTWQLQKTSWVSNLWVTATEAGVETPISEGQ